MIEIPEEKLFEDICALLKDALPAVLLEIEEQCVNGVRLPSFRYVGSPGKLSVGCALPYAFVEVMEGAYSEKDRIIRNVVYSVRIEVKLADLGLVWRYFAGIEETIARREADDWHITVEKKMAGGEMRVTIVR